MPKLRWPAKKNRLGPCYDPLGQARSSLRASSFGVKSPAASATQVWTITSKIPWYDPAKKGDCRLRYSSISVQANIRQVIDQILVDNPFDDLLLSDQMGQVVFQYSESSIRFGHIGLLFSTKQESLKKNENNNEAESYSSPASVQQTNEPKFLDRVPARQEVNIGGKDMYVFSNTMNLGTEDAGKYIVIGLVSKEKFRTQTWQFSSSVVLGLLFAVLLTLLSLPLLKLLTMGPQDRWSMTDFCLLVSAGILGIGLLAIGITDFSIFKMAKDNVDDELRSVATSVSRKFGEELRASISQLAKVDKHASLGDVKEESKEKDSSCLQGANAIIPVTKTHILKDKGMPTDYQFFDSIFWVDCSGRLRIHWDSRHPLTYAPPFAPNLTKRDYVSNVFNKRFYHLKEGSKDDLPPFLMEPVYSWIDGRFTTIVSIQSIHKFPREPTNAVAAIETHLLSLEQPIVEAGIGFAIVDSLSGKVLFHSDKKRNLRENLFAETDENRILKALSVSRGTDCFDGKYGGNSHRFCIEPLEDLPWTLTVFRNMEPLRAANLQVVIISSALYGGYSLVLIILLSSALTLRALRFAGLPDWIWPTESRHLQYRIVTWINCILLIIGSLALGLCSLENAFWVVVILLPLLGAICMLSVAYQVLPGWNPGKIVGASDSSWDYRKNYMSACGTMLALCAVLPATVCLSLSYEAESVLLMKSSALHLARGLAARADRIKQQYQPQKEFAPQIKARLSIEASQQEVSYARDLHLVSRSVRTRPEYDIVEMASEAISEFKDSKKETSDQFLMFGSLQRALRMPYDDEFVRTHGLAAVAQKTKDALWECKAETCFLTYRPVGTLHIVNGTEDTNTRWKVPFTPSNVERSVGVILVLLSTAGAFLVSLQGRMKAKAVVVLVLLVGVAAVYSPEVVLTTILLVGIPFSWFIYALPTIAARRIFLLDLPSVPIRSHEALSFAIEEKYLPPEVQELVDREFSASPRLVVIGNLSKGKFDRLQSLVSHVGPQQGVVSFVSEQALNYYRVLWAECTKYEKAALFQLAGTGFLSVVHAEMPLLLEKRLVVRDPAPKLMNQSFRQFVLSQEEEVSKLREEVSEGTWNLLEWPIGVTLALILAGLMYTQEELPSALSALVGGVPVLLPTIFKLLDLFKNEKPSISTS